MPQWSVSAGVIASASRSSGGGSRIGSGPYPATVRMCWAIGSTCLQEWRMDILRFRAEHLGGVLALCVAEGWPSLPDDPERALRILTAPGVTTVVAMVNSDVVGFASLLSDGELQACLTNLAVGTRV